MHLNIFIVIPTQVSFFEKKNKTKQNKTKQNIDLITKHIHLVRHIRRHTHPVSDVEEALFICKVEQEEETHCVSEECSR